MSRKRVLFLCTANSARSQMAEGFVRHFLGHRWSAHSAGVHPGEAVHPLAIQVMAEVGVDISQHHPKRIDLFRHAPLDLVVTVCDNAAEECPVWLGPEARLHLGFPDPAAVGGNEVARLAAFRQVRDDIRRRVLAELGKRE
jgi:arsenate reductase